MKRDKLKLAVKYAKDKNPSVFQGVINELLLSKVARKLKDMKKEILER